MAQHFLLMILGGVFILIGLVLFFWGRGEERKYYNAIAARADAREFMEHEPRRPEPGALKIGCWIAIAIGLLILAMGGIILLWS